MTKLPPIEFRVNFIRGRAQGILDSMLPLFASSLDSVCPTTSKGLTNELIVPLARFFPQATEKTLKNYATEIIGKLFGMVVHDDSGGCRISELTRKLLEDSDQPAFFKVLASRIQFPNPMNRMRSDFENDVHSGLHVRPLVLVLEVLRELGGKASYLELRTFVLANKNAYTNASTAIELAELIRECRASSTKLPDPSQPNRPWNHQHIKEMLGFLKLANLIVEDTFEIYSLNDSEISSLSWIFSTPSSDGMFRDLNPAEEYSEYQAEWSDWYGSIPANVTESTFDTTLQGLDISEDELAPNMGARTAVNTQELGKQGEMLVFAWQFDLVSHSRPMDIRHVKDRSAERGIGFDIQSVWMDATKAGQFRYIEVKTTKRSTRPELQPGQLDLVTLTSNEYRAARTHGDNFTLCRVYLFPGGFEVHTIDNPIQSGEMGDLIIEPASWSVYLTDKVIKDPEYASQ